MAWSFALILSGVAMAVAASTKLSALIAASAGIFLLFAAGMPFLIGWQIKRFLEERKRLSEAFPAFESRALVQTDTPPALQVGEPLSPVDDEEDLRRSQKAQAIERLRDGITHDLNNRLMVISANIDAVARHMKDQPILQRKLLSALVAADQAAKLIARTTTFARQGDPKVQYVDLAERVSSVASLMSRSLLRDTVELRLSLEEDLWPIEADPDDLETAIVTLSAHVRDALTQGGTITLEAQNIHVPKGALPSLDIEGEFVQMTIRSTGMGDALQATENPAEQTFSLRDIDLTSWLNLSQSLHFLQLLGGTSEVRRNGAETAIVLYLPRARAATLLSTGVGSDDDGLEQDDAPDHTEILVVDDEVEVALALQSMLEEFGYVTSIATDAGQAMKSLRARKPGLVLTDVAMPGTMNVVMLAREVRQIFPDLPVLLITGNPLVTDESSEFPLLQKPIVSRDLHAAIQRRLAPPDDNKIIPLFPRASQRVS